LKASDHSRWRDAFAMQVVVKRKDIGRKSKGRAECITLWSRDMNHRVIPVGSDFGHHWILLKGGPD